MLAVADLLVLVLRVLPGEIREWLNAERNLPGKKRKRRARLVRRARIWDLDKREDRRGRLPSRGVQGRMREEILGRRWCGIG